MSQGLRSSADTATRRPTAPGRGASSRPTGSGGASVIWVFIGLAIAAGIAYAERANSGNGSIVGWTVAGGASSGPLKVSGVSRNLYPGARRRMLVRIKNRSSAPLTVTRIRVAVGKARRGCPAKVLRAGRFNGRRYVPSGGARRVRIPITMLSSAGDACQGARFPLLFIYWAKP